MLLILIFLNIQTLPSRYEGLNQKLWIIIEIFHWETITFVLWVSFLLVKMLQKMIPILNHLDPQTRVSHWIQVWFFPAGSQSNILDLTGVFHSKIIYSTTWLRFVIVWKKFQIVHINWIISIFKCFFSHFSLAWLLPQNVSWKIITCRDIYQWIKLAFRAGILVVQKFPKLFTSFHFDFQTHNSPLLDTRFLPSSIKVSVDNFLVVEELWIV